MSIFYLNLKDTAPQLQAILINVDDNYNPVLNVSSILIRVLGKGRLIIENSAEVLDIPTKKVGYTWTPTDLALLSPGMYKIEFTVYYLDNSHRTFPNDGDIVQLKVT